MLAHVLAHVAWLVNHGYMDRATHELQQLLYNYRHNARITGQIHRAMYQMNPDWGL